MRILFIDDQVDEMRVHQRELEASGHVVGFIDNLDEAYQTLSQNRSQILYDVIFVDHDFSGYQGQIPNGMDLIVRLKAEHLLCPIIYFSAIQGDVEEVTKTISSFGACTFYKKSKFDGNQINCINEIRELSSFKRKIELKRIKIEENLRSFFQTLSQQQAFLWQMEVEKGANADWSTFEASIFGEIYKIDELLYDPVNTFSKEKMTETIKTYLKQSSKFGKFNDNFNEDCKEVFKDYVFLLEPEKSALEREISTNAINYLLDVLNVFRNVKCDDEEIFSLSPTNQSISVATTGIGKGKKDKSTQKIIFNKKLVLRRVLPALYYCFSSIPEFEEKYELDLKSKGYKLSYLFCLLKEGYTHPMDKEERIRTYTKILSVEQAKPSYHRIGYQIEWFEDIHNLYNTSDSDKPFKDYLLDEETKWVKSVSPEVYRVRCALDKIHYNNYINITMPDLGFNDLIHFRKWYEDSSFSFDDTNLEILKEFNVLSYFSDFLGACPNNE